MQKNEAVGLAATEGDPPAQIEPAGTVTGVRAKLAQLRVGEYRVIYDIDLGRRMVIVRAVLYKGNKTAGEIL